MECAHINLLGLVLIVAAFYEKFTSFAWGAYSIFEVNLNIFALFFVFSENLSPIAREMLGVHEFVRNKIIWQLGNRTLSLKYNS